MHRLKRAYEQFENDGNAQAAADDYVYETNWDHYDDDAGWREQREFDHRVQELLEQCYSHPPAATRLTSVQGKIDAQNVRAMQYAGQGTLELKPWLRLCWAFRGRCAYCYKPVQRAIIEHVIPVSAAGDTVLENVLPSCGRCNSQKKSRDLFEWKGANERFWGPFAIRLFDAMARFYDGEPNGTMPDYDGPNLKVYTAGYGGRYASALRAFANPVPP
jgi:5-methylcytosine-specific restriction endonuclease McrA